MTGRVVVAAEDMERVEAVDAGQADVEQHEVGRGLAGQRQPFGRGARSAHDVARSPERIGQAAAKKRVVVDEKDIVGHDKIIISQT